MYLFLDLPSLDVDIHLRMISTAQKVPDSI